MVLDGRPPPMGNYEVEPSLNWDPDIVGSWALAGADSGGMQAWASVQTAARRHMVSGISSFARPARLQ